MPGSRAQKALDPVSHRGRPAREYDGIKLDVGYRDLLVDGQIVVELKSVQSLDPVHVAQLVTYLRLANVPVGLLMNFNEVLLKDGLRRIVNRYRDPPA